MSTTIQYINEHLEPQELAMHIGYRVLPETAMSRQTGTTAAELLEPTFLYLDPDVFDWIYRYLDSKFLKTEFMLALAAAKRSMKHRRMVEPRFSVARKPLPLVKIVS